MQDENSNQQMNENNIIQTMPNNEAMLRNDFSHRDFLRFYQNLWRRQLVARICDLQYDMSADPTSLTDEMIQDAPNTAPRPKLVRERREERKVKVQAARDLLAAFDEVAKVLDQGDDKFTQTYLTDEALKVDESVFESEKNPDIASPCETPDGKPGTWQSDGNGNLLCIPNDDGGSETAEQPEPAPEPTTPDTAEPTPEPTPLPEPEAAPEPQPEPAPAAA